MISRVLRLDPRSWLFGWAVYCILTGITLIGPGGMLAVLPTYELMHAWCADGYVWGGLMIGDGVALLAIMPISATRIAAIITILSTALWALCGFTMVASGYRTGFVSGGGLWALCGAAICIISAGQLGRRL